MSFKLSKIGNCSEQAIASYVGYLHCKRLSPPALSLSLPFDLSYFTVNFFFALLIRMTEIKHSSNHGLSAAQKPTTGQNGVTTLKQD